MSSENEYLVPDVWAWEEESGGTFGSINRPVAGATFDKALPICLLYTSPSPRD